MTVVVGALYHPPKSIYETDKLDIFTAQYPDAVVILAGDLNILSHRKHSAFIAMQHVADYEANAVVASQTKRNFSTANTIRFQRCITCQAECPTTTNS